MAVAVVEALEVVDVHHEDAHRVVGPTPRAQERHVLLEVAPVGEAGQGVGRGGRLRRALGDRAREGRRRLGRGRGQEAARLLRPGRRAPPRDDDRAEQLAVGDEGRGKHVGEAEGAPDAPGDAVRRPRARSAEAGVPGPAPGVPGRPAGVPPAADAPARATPPRRRGRRPAAPCSRRERRAASGRAWRRGSAHPAAAGPRRGGPPRFRGPAARGWRPRSRPARPRARSPGGSGRSCPPPRDVARRAPRRSAARARPRRRPRARRAARSGRGEGPGRPSTAGAATASVAIAPVRRSHERCTRPSSGSAGGAGREREGSSTVADRMAGRRPARHRSRRHPRTGASRTVGPGRRTGRAGSPRTGAPGGCS